MMKRSKRWVWGTLGGLFLLLALVSALVIVLDPFMHYRMTTLYPYRVQNSNYVNSGLIKHMEYDAILVGSSMVENTEATVIDECFGVTAITIATKGGNALHHQMALDKAFDTHEVKKVFYALDVYAFQDREMSAGETMPDYLWNDSPWDDYKYWLNWDVLTNDLSYAIRQLRYQDAPRLTKDDWYRWEPARYARDQVLAGFSPDTKRLPMADPEEYQERFLYNIHTYLTPLLEAHPDTAFYLYLPPYSQMYWVHVLNEGILENHLWLRATLAELLLAYDNVQLYDFSTKADWILDLDNYTDYSHYRPEINQEITRLMARGEYRVRELSQVTAGNEWLRSVAYDFEW